MRSVDYTAGEVVRRGREMYERGIRSEVEPELEGKFLVLDIDTGDYFIADDDSEAFDRAEAKHPDGVYYVLRIGHRAAYRIGSNPVMLADGSIVEVGVYRAQVVWHGKRRRIEVQESEGGPFIGMNLPRGGSLYVEAIPGGNVVIAESL